MELKLGIWLIYDTGLAPLNMSCFSERERSDPWWREGWSGVTRASKRCKIRSCKHIFPYRYWQVPYWRITIWWLRVRIHAHAYSMCLSFSVSHNIYVFAFYINDTLCNSRKGHLLCKYILTPGIIEGRHIANIRRVLHVILIQRSLTIFMAPNIWTGRWGSLAKGNPSVFVTSFLFFFIFHVPHFTVSQRFRPDCIISGLPDQFIRHKWRLELWSKKARIFDGHCRT